jgi:adenylate cyclase
VKRKITAILAADIAEYTRLIAEDEEETLARLESWRQVFDDFIRRAGGRIFNTAGDGVMCEFPSAVEATRTAIDIQESLRTRNLAYPPGRQMHFRIGISIGDVVERDGDLLGDGVNVAARLQALAEPGGICVSRNVQEAVLNKISVPFRDMGEREVKNLPHPVHAYRVDINARDNPGPKDRAKAALIERTKAPTDPRGIPLSWIAASILLVSLGGAGTYLLTRNSANPVSPAGSPEAGRQAAAPAAQTAAPPPASTAAAPQPAPQSPPQQGTIVITENLSPAEAFERLANMFGIV